MDYTLEYLNCPEIIYREKINEKLMGINGNSCYKTHRLFLGHRQKLFGKFR